MGRKEGREGGREGEKGKQFLKMKYRDFPGGPVVKNRLTMQGTQVRSLVRELRSHMPAAGQLSLRATTTELAHLS